MSQDVILGHMALPHSMALEVGAYSTKLSPFVILVPMGF